MARLWLFWEGRGVHTTTQGTPNVHDPGASKTTKIPRKDPPTRVKKERKLWRARGKSEILGSLPHPSGNPPFGAPSSPPVTFRRHPDPSQDKGEGGREGGEEGRAEGVGWGGRWEGRKVERGGGEEEVREQW